MRRLLQEHPGLAAARLGSPPEGCDPGMTRSMLHVVTDWPGHYENGAAMVALLVDAGADIEAPGAVIAGGTALSDAVAFGQWQAAHRLVERGAHTPFREAAALGLLERIERSFASDVAPTPDDVTQAFWY